MSPSATVELAGALEDLRSGRMVAIRGKGGARLALAASAVDATAVNFMACDARGLISLALTPERCDALGLELIPSRAVDGRQTEAFTVSIEAREGVTTGISAADRARTIAVGADPESTEADVCSPGHVFPLRARPGGVLERAGEVEAAVDLTRAAGLAPAAVLCAILDEDGAPIGPRALERYCQRHGLRRIDPADVVELRREREALVSRISSSRTTTAYGDFETVVYRSLLDGSHHRALVKGHVAGREEVLVRVHTACPLGETFHASDCECGRLLGDALAAISAEGEGVLLYLSPRPGEEHRSDLGLGAQILADLGLSSLRLLIGETAPTEGLERHGLTLVDEIPVERGLDFPDEGLVRV